MIKKFSLLLNLFLALNISAQEQISNIDPELGDYSSIPNYGIRDNTDYFIEVNNHLLFVATNPQTETNLWGLSKIEGSKPKLIESLNNDRKIYPMISRSLNEFSIKKDNLLYFISAKTELWRTDGTSEGTQFIKQLDGLFRSIYKTINDEFIISTTNGKKTSLWISNGTSANTIKYHTINESNNSPNDNLIGFKELNNEVLLVNTDLGIWITDGTSENTNLIINDEKIVANTKARINSEVYFTTIRSSDNAYIFYNYNLTDNILTKIKEFADYNLISTTITVNDKAYVSIAKTNNSNNYEWEIWESQGTENTTNLISTTEVNFSSFPFRITSDNSNNLALLYRDKDNQLILSKLNINNNFITEVKQFLDNARSSSYNIEFNKETNLFFIYTLENDQIQTQFWTSDLTNLNTIQVDNLNGALNVFPFNDKFYFPKVLSKNETPQIGVEIWEINQTFEDLNLVENLNTEKFTFPYNLRVKHLINDNLVFQGHLSQDIKGYNFSSNNVEQLISSEITGYPIERGNYRKQSIIFQNKSFEIFRGLFPTSSEFSKQSKVFISDGTVNGTKEIDESNIYNNDRFKILGHIFNNKLYFLEFDRKGSNNISDHRRIITSYDGSNYEKIAELEPTTERYFDNLLDLKFAFSGSDKFYMIRSNLFQGRNANITISDGISNALEINANAKHAIIFKDELYFSGSKNTEDTNIQLYKINKLTNAVELLKKIYNNGSSNPANFRVLNDKLVFTAFTEDNGIELWVSDGTTEGTILLKDINNSPTSSFHNNFIQYNIDLQIFEELNNELFFLINHENSGTELWKTDGTTNGTVAVTNNSKIKFNAISDLKKINSNLYFTAETKEHGEELWKTDGTPEGTAVAVDLVPGSGSSYPDDIFEYNNEVYFWATANEDGRQIWKLLDSTLNTTDLTIENSNIFLYPNPTSDFIYFNNIKSVNNIKIYSVDGSQVISIKELKTDKLDISNLANGTYIITCNLDSINTATKIVKL